MIDPVAARVERAGAVVRLLFIRHGITDWNQQGRIQGWTDIPLNACGRQQLACCALPCLWRDAECFTSTLTRSIETAQLLGARQPRPEAALREMCWGRWEGRTLAELRRGDPAGLAENERKGLDFTPEDGESPRAVRERLAAWLGTLPQDLERAVVVTHKGVIRAALSLASGWDMRGKFSPRIDWLRGQEFSYARHRGLAIEQLNLSLQKSAGDY